MVSPELAALVTAIVAVLIEVARLLREKRLRARGEKRTRAEDQEPHAGA